MKLPRLASLILISVAFTGSLFAQDAAPATPPAKKKIAITKIAATDSVKTRMVGQGTGLSSQQQEIFFFFEFCLILK